MNIRTSVIIFCLLGINLLSAQEFTDDAEIVLNDLFAQDSLDIQMGLFAEKTHVLYLHLNFDEQAYFSGRNFGIDQHSWQPNLTYMHGKHWFFNTNAAYYSGLDPNWDVLGFSTGYFTALGKSKKWSLSALYNRLFFGENEVEEWNRNRIASSLSYRLKSLKFRLGVGWLFGGENSVYISQSSHWKIPLVKHKKFSCTINPSLRWLWSEQQFTEEVVSGRLGRRITEIEQEVFDLINVAVEIPLSVEFGVWDLNLNYQMNFPRALPNEESLENTQFFSVGLGYFIDL